MTAMDWFDALQWIHVALILIILLVFACYVYVLVKVTSLEFVGGLVGKWRIRVFGIVSGSFVVLYLLYNLYKIQPSGWVEISLLAGLVAATGTLALVTLQQAHAMKEQTESLARPYLLMRLEHLLKLEGDFDKLINAAKYEIPSNFTIKIRNEGTGPAINIIAAFWRSDNVFPFQPKGYLAPQEEWQTTISTLRIDVDEIGMWLPELREIVKYDYPGTIAIEYRDIHERTWVTYLQLQKYFLEENYIHIGEGKQSIVEIGRAEK